METGNSSPWEVPRQRLELWFGRIRRPVYGATIGDANDFLRLGEGGVGYD